MVWLLLTNFLLAGLITVITCLGWPQSFLLAIQSCGGEAVLMFPFVRLSLSKPLLSLFVVVVCCFEEQNNNRALHWTHLWLLNAGIFSGSGTGLSWGWSSWICFDFSNCIYFCFFLLVLIMGSCRKCLPNKCRQSLLCSKIIVKDLPFLDALASLDFKLSVSGSVMFFS